MAPSSTIAAPVVPFRNLLSGCRTTLGLTQGELAALIGDDWDQHRVSKIEAGKRAIPERDTEAWVRLGAEHAQMLDALDRAEPKGLGEFMVFRLAQPEDQDRINAGRIRLQLAPYKPA